MLSYLKKYLPLLAFLSGIFTIYSVNLSGAFLLTTDFGRDMYHSLRIAQGDLVLIGPKMNFGGYYAGPYYYYLFAPILLISNFSINAVLYFHTLLFALAVTFFFYTISKKYDYLRAILASLTIAILPFFILSSRHPSNGYTYFPFLLFLATLVFFYNFKNKISIFILGILAGVIVNIHPASIFPTFFLSLYLILKLKNKFTIAIFLLGGLIAFLPLMVFELRHDFIMTRDTFINNSLNTYVNSPTKPQLTLHQNPFLSILFYLLNKFKDYLNINYIGFFVIPFFVAIYQIKKEGFLRQNAFLILSLVISFLLLFPLMLFHYENHYLFGVMLYISLAATLIILNSRFFYLLIIFVLINIYFSPVNLYQTSDQLIKKVDQAVGYAIDKKLVTKNDSFNLIRVADAYARVPTGFEYRFFFRKYGYFPNSEYDYKEADTLLIFSETPFYDIDRFKMWATEEFGREYFVTREVHQINGTTIYKITKN